MNMNLKRLSHKDGGVCLVCRGRAWGTVGFSPNKYAKAKDVMWLCGNLECTALAKEVSNMPQKVVDRIKLQSVKESTDIFGEFCVTALCETDIMKMSDEQLCNAFLAFLQHYEKRMLENTKNDDEIPF
jgi:hypothetical protein